MALLAGRLPSPRAGSARPPGAEAVAVWIPPGGVELTEEEEARFPPPHELSGARAPTDILELLERFDASHPHGAPHYYLSLLGTDPPPSAAAGLGMALLRPQPRADRRTRECRRLPRVEQPGERRSLPGASASRPNGSFTTSRTTSTAVTTMWRDPR